MARYTQPEVFFPYQKDYGLTKDAKVYEKCGVSILHNTSYCVIILAGGQGTRLGTKIPKGCYILPDLCVSIFEVHCLGLYKAQKMYNLTLKLLIMTSSHTHKHIVDFFQQNDYFNFDKDNVIFFQQGEAICIDDNGDPIRLYDGFATSPNGNGGIFEALHNKDIFSKIQDCLFVNVISVDNLLARAVDPVCVGYLYKKGLDVVSKGIEKLQNENVGVFVQENGHVIVKEYSEITSFVKDLKKDDLNRFSQGNICNHLFTTEFLYRIPYKNMPIHKAYKKIPYTDAKNEIVHPNTPNGYKQELFIFDCLKFTSLSGVMSVPREIEFAPIKNSVELKVDNPETAVKALKMRNNLFKKISNISLDLNMAFNDPFELIIYNELETYEDTCSKK